MDAPLGKSSIEIIVPKLLWHFLGGKIFTKKGCFNVEYGELLSIIKGYSVARLMEL